MIFNTQSGTVTLGDSEMDYVSFGEGKNTLIMLPGLGDAFRKIKSTALPFAMAYHRHAKDYKVYMFSRKKTMTKGYSIRDMAKDQAEAMKILGISKADIMGVSQGGMIAQYLAIDHPEMVRKLVLVVTLCRQNETIQSAVKYWIALAQEENYAEIMIETIEKSYSEKTIEKYRALYPILSRFGKNKDYDRFLIQAHACLNHDSHQELYKITCPTLVVGGDSDQIAGSHSSAELASYIKDSELLLYEGLGHATYEEADNFFEKVLSFLEIDAGEN